MPQMYGTYWRPQLDIFPEKIKIQQKRSDTWKATGKGFYNNPLLANFTANESNASKLELVNIKYHSSANGQTTGWQQETLDTKPVFVTSISVKWDLHYSSGQSPFGKTFYPHDISYTSCVLRGQTKSQHDYDLLVDWVINSQKSAVDNAHNVVKYTLKQKALVVKNGVEIFKFPHLSFRGYIRNIRAGHRTGNFAPEFELDFVLLSFGGNDLQITNGTDNFLLTTDYGADTIARLVDSLKLGSDANAATDTGYIKLPKGVRLEDFSSSYNAPEYYPGN